MERRKSLAYNVVQKQNVFALRFQEESFYGFVSDCGSSSSLSEASDVEESHGHSERTYLVSSAERLKVPLT